MAQPHTSDVNLDPGIKSGPCVLTPGCLAKYIYHSIYNEYWQWAWGPGPCGYKPISHT